MPSINDNDLNNNELDEKVANFIRPKLEEINKNIDELVESAKVSDLDVATLQDIINLNPPESQEEYNFVVELQKTAKDLLQNQEEYNFLLKSNDEVMDYLDDHINQTRLEICAKKVFLYRELGHDVEADELEEDLRDLALGKRIKKNTFNNIFKSYDEQKKGSKQKSNFEECPAFEVYGYDERRTVWLGHGGNIEELPASSLKKELPIIFGGSIDVDEVITKVQNQAAQRGRITTRRILKQGIHLIDDLWVVISGKRAVSINKNTFEKEEITDPLFGKYFLLKEGEEWIDLDLITPADPRQHVAQGSLKDCLDEVTNVISKWEWKNKSVIPHVAAFFMLTAFQQAMHWRPILYLSGEKATGKTTFSKFFEDTFSGLFEKIDKTTAHAIKQTFGDNSKAGILDEFEHYKSEKQQKDILNLLKTTCGGGKVSFGTTGKHARECHLHHLFWIASISFPKCVEVDSAMQDRIIVFPLRKKEHKYVSLPKHKDLKALGVKIINTMLSNWNKTQETVDFLLEEENVIDQCKKFNVGARQVENFVWASSLINIARGQKNEDLQLIPSWAIKASEDDGDRILEEILSTRVKHYDGHIHGEGIVSDLMDDALFEFSEVKGSCTDSDIRDSLEKRSACAIHTLRNNYITLARIGDSKELYVAIQANKLSSFFEKKDEFSGVDIKTILSRIESIKVQKARFGQSILKAILIPMKKINDTFGRGSVDNSKEENTHKIEPIKAANEGGF